VGLLFLVKRSDGYFSQDSQNKPQIAQTAFPTQFGRRDDALDRDLMGAGCGTAIGAVAAYPVGPATYSQRKPISRKNAYGARGSKAGRKARRGIRWCVLRRAAGQVAASGKTNSTAAAGSPSGIQKKPGLRSSPYEAHISDTVRPTAENITIVFKISTSTSIPVA
jgi:hypothetical protein